MNQWQFAVTPWLVAAFIIVGGLAAYFSWRIWIQNGRSRRVLGLEAFRWLIILMLLLTLLRPERVQVVNWAEEPAVVVLSDLSASMSTRDVVQTNGVVTRREWVDQQITNQVILPLQSNSRVLVDGFGSPTEGIEESGTLQVEGTDLNAALETVIRREANLKPVLILSDGDWNLGNSPALAASLYRNQGIPLFAVEVGQDAPLPDIELESVSAPSYGLLGEQISLPFRVYNLSLIHI